MANDPDILQRAIEKETNPHYLYTNRSDIIQHYKDTYGDDGWKSAIAHDLVGIVKNKRGEDVSYRNIRRRFEGTREGGGKLTAKSTTEYRALGEKLPSEGRDLKGNSITLTFSGIQNGRERTITHTMTGTHAWDFVNNPNWKDWWDDYREGLGDVFEKEGSGEFTVYAA